MLLMYFLGGAIVVALLFLVFGAGINVGKKEAFKDSGWSENSQKLLSGAARLINRTVTFNDLDGDFGQDILSDKTKTLFVEWLTDYKKEINKI